MIKVEHDFDVEVAELLSVGGYLKPCELDKAFAYKRNCGVPIEETILKAGLCDPRILDGARKIVNAIHQNRLPKNQGSTALWMIANSGVSFDESLQKLGLCGSVNPWHRQLLALRDRNY